MFDTLKRLDQELDAFRRVADGGHQYEWCASHDGGQHQQHIVFGIMVHGDEVGALPAAIRVIHQLRGGQIHFGGKVSFFIGNPEAGRAGLRFLEADLNRVFLPNPHQQHEHKRARQIMPILEQADVFIDFHQTIQPTQNPFYICPWSDPGWRWARALGAASVWVTRPPGQTFSAGTCCTDEYVRHRGRVGLTVELSKKGFTQQADDIAARTMLRALEIMETLAVGAPPTLTELSERQPDLQFVRTIHQEPFESSELALRSGLVNFQAVAPGERISAEGAPVLTVPVRGQLLFPKYPQRQNGRAQGPLPKEIFRVVQTMPIHPAQLWGDQSLSK